MLYNGCMNSIERQPITPEEWFDLMRQQLSEAKIGEPKSSPYDTRNGLDRLRLLALRRIRQEKGI